MTTLASVRERNHSMERHSSRHLPLKLSTMPFCQGLPGSIKAMPSPWPAPQRNSDFETNPGHCPNAGGAEHRVHCNRSGDQFFAARIQAISGDELLKKATMASTSTGKIRLPRSRQVWRRERTRSVHRSPFSLAVPKLTLRKSTANRRSRSA